jgi:hypothetical protein
MAQKDFINIDAYELCTAVQPILGLSVILSPKVVEGNIPKTL